MSRRRGIIHIDFAGPFFTIMVCGQKMRFEDHRYCGPVPINKRDEEKKLAPNHRFWEAVTQWYQAGRPMNPDGTCHWEPKEARS